MEREQFTQCFFHFDHDFYEYDRHHHYSEDYAGDAGEVGTYGRFRKLGVPYFGVLIMRILPTI